jgi:hypothetical protein
MMDFNNADQQRDYGDLIPDKTFARVRMTIRQPDFPDQGNIPILTKSKTSNAEYLDCEFEIMSEPMKGRKLWQNVMVAGVQEKAQEISKSFFRAILESARNIHPTDNSPIATEARRVSGFEDFQSMEFCARIGIEPGKGGFKDKNKIGLVVTPDKAEYAGVMAGKTIPGAVKPEQQFKPASWTAGGGQPAQAQPAAAAWGNKASTQQPAAQPAPAAAGGSPIPSWAK